MASDTLRPLTRDPAGVRWGLRLVTVGYVALLVAWPTALVFKNVPWPAASHRCSPPWPTPRSRTHWC